MRLTRRLAKIEMALIPPPAVEVVLSPEQRERMTQIMKRYTATPALSAELFDTIQKVYREKGEQCPYADPAALARAFQ